MKFKGSTGNWFIEQDKEFPTLHNIWAQDKSIFTNGTLVARTCYAPLSGFNAALISKAPTMLEYLQDFVDAYDDGELDDLDMWYYRAEQIIKHATEL